MFIRCAVLAMSSLSLVSTSGLIVLGWVWGGERKSTVSVTNYEFKKQSI